MGLNPKVVSGFKTIGHRGCDPVDIQTQQVENFPGHDGDFRRVYAIGTEHGTPSAFGALKEIIPPFLQYAQGHGSGTGQCFSAGYFAQDLGCCGKIVPVYGS